ncbi:hypothetical protein LMG28688_00241 [Paraburkholderia caffeinitolerans]|uniref:Uncharacterized protein n=1 Tax=Paraburkholderia caffeinitolerans TaxID=1723730 RepID=A0A6J5FFF3_9BURK|nr:hypothetical protein LMG28688_00241 [Paraburkholderia caffeinitolerans]
MIYELGVGELLGVSLLKRREFARSCAARTAVNRSDYGQQRSRIQGAR